MGSMFDSIFGNNNFIDQALGSDANALAGAAIGASAGTLGLITGSQAGSVLDTENGSTSLNTNAAQDIGNLATTNATEGSIGTTGGALASSLAPAAPAAAASASVAAPVESASVPVDTTTPVANATDAMDRLTMQQASQQFNDLVATPYQQSIAGNSMPSIESLAAAGQNTAMPNVLDMNAAAPAETAASSGPSAGQKAAGVALNTAGKVAGAALTPKPVAPVESSNAGSGNPGMQPLPTTNITGNQPGIYSTVFGSNAGPEPSSMLAQPTVPKFGLSPPPPIVSDRKLKVNIKKADRPIKDFLTKIGSYH